MVSKWLECDNAAESRTIEDFGKALIDENYQEFYAKEPPLATAKPIPGLRTVSKLGDVKSPHGGEAWILYAIYGG